MWLRFILVLQLRVVGYIDVESAFVLSIAKHNLQVRVISFFVNFHIEFLANHPYCLGG